MSNLTSMDMKPHIISIIDMFYWRHLNFYYYSKAVKVKESLCEWFVNWLLMGFLGCMNKLPQFTWWFQ